MDSRLKEMTAVLKKYKLTHGLTPEKFRLILQELGPTYIKLGQIMSLHSDILPKEYCEELMKLCSDVEPMPFEQVEAVIDASFGYSWKDVFASIETLNLINHYYKISNQKLRKKILDLIKFLAVGDQQEEEAYSD